MIVPLFCFIKMLDTLSILLTVMRTITKRFLITLRSSRKDYSYNEHLGPHDLDQTDFATGRTRREVAYQLGLRFKIAPKLSIEDGIRSKNVASRCYIDVDNCKKFINAFETLSSKVQKEKDRMYSAKPNHDWSSHFNDALRVLATGMERSQLQNKKQFQRDYNYEFSI